MFLKILSFSKIILEVCLPNVFLSLFQGYSSPFSSLAAAFSTYFCETLSHTISLNFPYLRPAGLGWDFFLDVG